MTEMGHERHTERVSATSVATREPTFACAAISDETGQHRPLLSPPASPDDLGIQ